MIVLVPIVWCLVYERKEGEYEVAHKVNIVGGSKEKSLSVSGIFVVP